MNESVRIAHIITTLEYGGAENMLFKLVSKMATDPRYEQMVISLTDKGVFGPMLEKQQVDVYSVGLRMHWLDMVKAIKIISKIKAYKPHILQTWLYHADLLGTFAARVANCRDLIWNIRCSDMAFGEYAWTTKIIFQILKRMSGIPSVVCANSQAGIRVHKEKGYKPKKWVWIPNGFDIERFRPHPSPESLRTRLGIPVSSKTVGIIARFDPMKDFDTFFKAAHIVTRLQNNVHFILVGHTVDNKNPYLSWLVDNYKLADNIHMLGRRRDVELIYPAMDVFTLSSAFGEGFPNVLGEAMACGVPCVATDVGDSKLIIGDTGIVVPPKDPKLLATAWLRILNAPAEKRKRLAHAARRRIVDEFRLETIQRKYMSLYESLGDTGGRLLACGKGLF